MRRRCFVTGIGAVTTGALAGCLDSDDLDGDDVPTDDSRENGDSDDGNSDENRSENGDNDQDDSEVIDPRETIELTVLQEVEINTETDTAKVQLVDDPLVEAVVAESTTDSQSTEQPSETDTLTVQLDADGDELVVEATHETTTAVVYRQLYPEDRQVISGFTVVDGPVLTAQVTFGQGELGEQTTISSTVANGEQTATDDGIEMLALELDEDGDEIVGKRTREGQIKEVYRERHWPEPE